MRRPIFTLFLMGNAVFSLNAQESNSKWDVHTPAPAAANTHRTAEHQPIELKVLHSRSTRIRVTEKTEMPDLPSVEGDINFTVQIVEDPISHDLLPQNPALKPDSEEVGARLAELKSKHRATRFIFLSATVYDQNRTYVRIYPSGGSRQKVEAWSNINFNHFTGFTTYRVKDALDGSSHDFTLLIVVANIDTHRWKERVEGRGGVYLGPKPPEIPEMRDLANEGPAFAVVEGQSKSRGMDALEQIHDLYRKEGAKFEKAHHDRLKARAERKAFLIANPPQPQDVTTWITEPRLVQPAGGSQSQK